MQGMRVQSKARIDMDQEENVTHRVWVSVSEACWKPHHRSSKVHTDRLPLSQPKELCWRDAMVVLDCVPWYMSFETAFSRCGPLRQQVEVNHVLSLPSAARCRNMDNRERWTPATILQLPACAMQYAVACTERATPC